MKLKWVSSFLWLIVLLPSLASAHSFDRLDPSLLFRTESALYRQRHDRPWQLANLPSGTKIHQSISLNNQEILLTESGGSYQVQTSDNGLKFTPVSIIGSAQELTFRLVGSDLWILGRYNTTWRLFLTADGQHFSTADGLQFSALNQLQQLLSVGSGTVYLAQQANQTVVYQRQGNQWVSVTVFNCLQERRFDQPFVGVLCQDGTVYYPVTAQDWQLLPADPLQLTQFSQKLIVAQSKTNLDSIFIWADNSVLNITVPPPGAASLDRLIAFDDRAFLHFSSDGWFELLWRANPVHLSALPLGPSAQFVLPPSGTSLFLTSDQTAVYSPAPEQWSSLTLAGIFNHAVLVPGGWLIWQTDATQTTGGITQFSANPPGVFTKVNPWASTTSPVQALNITPTISYLSVITSSGQGNVNLYKTTDFTHWTRLTLPTQATFFGSVNEIRQVPSGSLVELIGSQSVVPGIVDSEAMYLQDASGGLQIFLSQTKGILPTSLTQSFLARGEVSTSQTKRVLLDDLADLELLGTGEVSTPTMNADEAANHMGQIMKINGQATLVDSASISLKTLSVDLKLHYTAAKDKFLAKDEVTIPSVVDWNSSSGKVEAWYLGSGSELISRSATTTTTTAAVTSTSLAKSSPKTSTKQAAAGSASTGSKVAAQSSGVPKANSVPMTQVAAAHSSNSSSLNQSSLTVLLVLTLLSSFIVSRGRRFQNWLSAH